MLLMTRIAAIVTFLGILLISGLLVANHPGYAIRVASYVYVLLVGVAISGFFRR